MIWLHQLPDLHNVVEIHLAQALFLLQRLGLTLSEFKGFIRPDVEKL